MTALLALVRVGSHGDREAVLARMVGMKGLSAEQELARLRIIQVALARHKDAAKSSLPALTRNLDQSFSKAPAELKREIARVLLYLSVPGAVSKAMQAMGGSDSREGELFYVELLRNVNRGWTLAERERFFAWFLEGGGQKSKGKEVEKYFEDVQRRYVDGASYDGYLRDFRAEAIATLSAEEKQRLEPLLARTTVQALLVPRNDRQFVREWKVEDLLADLGKDRKADLGRGRQAFVDAQCLACHRFGNDGGASGPELNSAGRKYTERDLLESILEPSKVVSDQYQDHVIATKEGEVFTGRLVANSDEEVIIETDRVVGTRERIKKGDVESMRPSTLSPMPQGLVNVLSKEEILDLLAYLRSGVARVE